VLVCHRAPAASWNKDSSCRPRPRQGLFMFSFIPFHAKFHVPSDDCCICIFFSCLFLSASILPLLTRFSSPSQCPCFSLSSSGLRSPFWPLAHVPLYWRLEHARANRLRYDCTRLTKVQGELFIHSCSPLLSGGDKATEAPTAAVTGSQLQRRFYARLARFEMELCDWAALNYAFLLITICLSPPFPFIFTFSWSRGGSDQVFKSRPHVTVTVRR